MPHERDHDEPSPAHPSYQLRPVNNGKFGIINHRQLNFQGMKHLLYFMGLVQLKVRAQTEHCPSSESQWSIPGWTLQWHIYEPMPSDLGLRCLVRCQTDDWCQSFNFVLSCHMCEFSDRTKEEVTLDSVTTLKLSTGREVPLNFRCFILFIRLQI